MRGKLESQPARTFPDPAAVMDYYLTEATPISIDGLPKETPNLIYNPGIEQSSDGWVDSFEAGLDCTLDRDTSEAFSGTASLSVSDRSSAEDGPCFYLTSVAKSGRKVRCRAMVKTEGPSVRFRWMLHTRARSGNESWTNGPWVRVDGNWTEVNATMTYDTWSGPLERAMVKIESHKDDVLEAFRLDDAQCVEFGGEHRLTHLVLSDRSNPFGAVNATGTYVIDCGGKNLLVEHCRIRGTLVIVDPGAGSRIGTGPVSIEPTSPGKASLVVEGNIRIECSGAGLNETYHQVNFNPPGTLYLPLGEDSDQIDTLPSQLSGIIYATGDLVVAGQSRVVDGVLLANGKLTVREHAMIIGTGTLRLNPPPPFRSDWTIRWLERSFRLP